MKDIAELISTQLLPRVSRPAQYIGLETNARNKDFVSAGLRVAMAFPDAYAVGISHLGSQVLYHALNDIEGVACDRTYCPMPDAERVMRGRGVPLFGWESRMPVGGFDILGFSMPYEVCATNFLTMLDLAGVPLAAEDRGPGQPIIVAGDALADSPEPLAEFVDLFLVGDGEQPLSALASLALRMKSRGASREDVIIEAARTIPGAYAPRYYNPLYGPDGCYAGLEPSRDDLPRTISHVHLPRLEDSPSLSRPLVPLSQAVHERVVVEVMRGCPNSCRFCQAGATRLPVRFRGIEEIVRLAREGIEATGFDEISLLSLSTGDYPRLDELMERLNAEFAHKKISISLPSLRVDERLSLLPKLASAVRKGGLTIAAEAGSDRLRNAIKKDISEHNMIEGVRAAFRAGWRSVKVYFMAGLPGETDADIDEIFHLCRTLSDARRDVDGHRGAISASVSWFVPKPHTPMQWCPMRDAEYFMSVRRRLRDLSRRTPVSFRFHRVERSVLEGVICRGDRRVGRAILAAWLAGARMDAWDEHFDWSRWLSAFGQAGVAPAIYANRELQPGQALPWDHIRCYRSREFLEAEYNRMKEALCQSPGIPGQ